MAKSSAGAADPIPTDPWAKVDACRQKCVEARITFDAARKGEADAEAAVVAQQGVVQTETDKLAGLQQVRDVAKSAELDAYHAEQVAFDALIAAEKELVDSDNPDATPTPAR